MAKSISREELTSSSNVMDEVQILGIQAIQASKMGKLEEIKNYIDEGNPINFQNSKGWTPLLIAACNGHLEIVSYLLKHGAGKMYELKSDSIDPNNNNVQLQPQVKNQQPNIENQQPHGENQQPHGENQQPHVDKNEKKSGSTKNLRNTPLHWASFKGHLDLVYHLLEFGFSTSDLDSYCNTPLHLACSGSHFEIVRLLLSQGVDLSLKNSYGNSPLDLAINVKIKKLLESVASKSTCKQCDRTFSKNKQGVMCVHCHEMLCESCIETKKTCRSPNGIEMRSLRLCRLCLEIVTHAENALLNIIERKISQNDRYLWNKYFSEIKPLERNCIASSTTLIDDVDKKKEVLEDIKEISTNDQQKDNAVVEKEDHVQNAEKVVEDEKKVVENGEKKVVENAEKVVENEEKVVESIEKIVVVEVEEVKVNLVNEFEQVKVAKEDGDKEEEKKVEKKEETLEEIQSLNHIKASSFRRLDMINFKELDDIMNVIEKARSCFVDDKLIQQSLKIHSTLESTLNLVDVMEKLASKRPVTISSEIHSLKEVLQNARSAGVDEQFLQQADQLCNCLYAECSLYGIKELCKRIPCGGEQSIKDMKRLKGAIHLAESQNIHQQLLLEAKTLLLRLNCELQLKKSLMDPPENTTPLQNATSASSSTTIENTTSSSKNTTSSEESLYKTIELHLLQITEAIEKSADVPGVDPSLLEEATNLQRKVKKNLRDEQKKEEERKRLQEAAAALRAAKRKAKKGKK